jgi:AcrR family transcriptional regulator
MRALATELGVSPNALYRYYPSKSDLSVALADAGGRILLDALREASAGLPPLLALRATAQAYLRFARSRPALYAVKMQHGHGPSSGQPPPSHTEVWAFVMALTSALHTRHDPRDLAVAMWASLHGLVELDRADLLDGRDPAAALDVMLDVTLSGLMAQQAAPT